MRESLASAINAHTLEQKEQPCAVDKIHALGLAAINNNIGVLTLHFIDGLQPSAHKQLIYSLAKQASRMMRCDRNLLAKLAHQVVFESALIKCKSCRGVSHHIINNKVVHCPQCKGSGLWRHSDYERAKALGVDEEIYLKHWSKRFKIMQTLFTEQTVNTLRVVREKI